MAGLSSGVALAIIIFVTMLWGSWFQVVKHTGDYPIYAFLSWLYAFSIVIVWGSILLLQQSMVPAGVLAEIAADLPRAGIVFFCGAMYAIGMQLQLTVVGAHRADFVHIYQRHMHHSDGHRHFRRIRRPAR